MSSRPLPARGDAATTRRRDDPRAFIGALDVLPEAALRDFVRAWRKRLKPAERGAFEEALVAHAARAVPGWAPPANDPALVANADLFVRVAQQRGQGDPATVDALLQRAGRALAAGDAAAARAVYERVLEPVAAAEIDLGPGERVRDVLTVSVDEAVGRYLVAVYETTPPDQRAEAVLSALAGVERVAPEGDPLALMERAATRPLADFDRFAPQCRARLERDPDDPSPPGAPRHPRAEATARAPDAAELERVALESGDADALRDWCRALAAEARWADLLDALLAAAERLADDWHRPRFLEGAAVVATRLGRPAEARAHLEAALRVAPTPARLFAVLDHGGPDGAELGRRAEAWRADPALQGARSAALLALLTGRVDEAADRLGRASGLGWSLSDHPGERVFGALVLLVGGRPPPGSVRELVCGAVSEPLEVALPFPSAEAAPLPVPALAELLERRALLGTAGGAAIRETLRHVADARADGVSRVRRQRHYQHAARVALCCVELERAFGEASTAEAWLGALRERMARLPAFMREIRQAEALAAR